MKTTRFIVFNRLLMRPAPGGGEKHDVTAARSLPNERWHVGVDLRPHNIGETGRRNFQLSERRVAGTFQIRGQKVYGMSAELVTMPRQRS